MITGRMKSETTFTITHEIDGEMVDGTFTATRLSARALARRGIIASQYQGGERSIDQEDAWRALKMAHLDVSLTQKPVWFDWDRLLEDPIEEGSAADKVFEKVRAFQDSFRRLAGEAPALQQGAGAVAATANGVRGAGASAAQPAGPGDLGRGAGVVVERVPSPLDP